MAGNHQRWNGRGLDKAFVIVSNLMEEPSRLHIISFVISFSQCSFASGVLVGYATRMQVGFRDQHIVIQSSLFLFYGGMDDDEM